MSDDLPGYLRTDSRLSHVIPSNLSESDVKGLRSLRLSRLTSAVAQHGASWSLIADLASIRYLVGFSGSHALLLVSANPDDDALLYTDGRYVEQATQSALSYGVENLAVHTGAWFEEVSTRVMKGSSALLVDEDALSASEVKKLSSIKDACRPLGDVMKRLREVKDRDELSCIGQAAAIADAAARESLKALKDEPSELELAGRFEYFVRHFGAEATSFETIVASGPRSALPHGHPTSRRVREGDVLVFDFGAVFEGYRSDATRTLFIGDPPPRIREAYDLVARSQAAGASRIAVGNEVSEVEEGARKVLKDQGEEAALIHGIGHGVGLDIHEDPFTAARSGSRFQEGTTVTVEPGVYYPDNFGIRIEDLFCIIDQEPRCLSVASQSLELDHWS